jgi:hypothetical protein
MAVQAILRLKSALLIDGLYELCRWDGFMRRFMQTRRSSNIKALPQKSERLYCWYDWLEGFMNYAGDMGSGALIYIPDFIQKIGSAIQKLIGGIHIQSIRWSDNVTFIFSKWGKQAKNQSGQLVTPSPKYKTECTTVRVKVLYIINYKQHNPSWEAAICSATQEISNLLWNPNICNHVHTILWH